MNECNTCCVVHTDGKCPGLTTAEMQALYSVSSFAWGICLVTRKSDGQKGTLDFTHNPRVYFGFVANDGKSFV